MCRSACDGCNPALVCAGVARFLAIPTCDKRGAHAGVTLANDDSSSLYVLGLNRRDAAFAHGLRIGDVIVSINGLTGLGHPQAVALIDAATRSGTGLVVGIAADQSCHISRRPGLGRLRRAVFSRMLQHAARRLCARARA
jgi:hypothetical protein